MKIIIEYLKDKKNQKIGLVSAHYSLAHDRVLIGFSLCNVKHGDKFDKKLAFEICKNRMIKYNNLQEHEINIPFKVRDKLYIFIPRIKQYYKDKNLTDWVKIYKN